MDIRIVTDKISLDELKPVAEHWYGDMIKGAVDVEQEVLALGGEYHMDANMVLIEAGSRQGAIWGFNIHLNRERKNWIEFTSLINIRPAQGNRGMVIESRELQGKIRAIIEKKLYEQ